MGFGTLQEREQRVLDQASLYISSGEQDKIDRGTEMETWAVESEGNITDEFNQAVIDAANSPTEENIEKKVMIMEVIRIKYPELVEPYIYTEGVILD